LDGTLPKRFHRANLEIAEQVNSDRGGRVVFPLGRLYAINQPAYDLIPRGVIWSEFVVGANVPNPELTVSTVKMQSSMDRHAWFRCVQLIADSKEEQ